MKKKQKKKRKTIEEKENYQLAIFIGVIFLIFLGFLIPYFYIQSQKVFNYLGVTWQIQEHGDLTVYHTRFPKIYQGVNYGYHNVYLRNNPKENNIQTDIKELKFKENVYVTQSKEILECKNQVLVSSTLGQITQALPFIKKTQGATTNQELAQQENITHITCKNIPNKTTVIQLEISNQTKISNPKDSCYLIEIEDCEKNILSAEKLVIEIIKGLGFEKIEWTNN